jgi:hypothetical protein
MTIVSYRANSKSGCCAISAQQSFYLLKRKALPMEKNLPTENRIKLAFQKIAEFLLYQVQLQNGGYVVKLDWKKPGYG